MQDINLVIRLNAVISPRMVSVAGHITLYPFIHALRHTKSYEDSGHRLVKKDTVDVACPDNAWVVFEIEKL